MASAAVVAALFFAFFLLTVHTLQPALVALTPVRNAAENGAVCLDGSTPQYHFDRGSGAGADNWVLHLEGGAWCNSTESCLQRSRTRYGSSLYMDSEVFDGIMSPFRSQNPDFYNWNRVLVRYCDGASFAGNAEDRVVNGTKLFFRGQRIWEAVMSDLLSQGLAYAKLAFLTGCSSGGLATYLHRDSLQELLPRVVTVKCLADAGFFLDRKDVSGKRSFRSFFDGVVHLQNVVENLQKDCLSKKEPTLCFFPHEIIKHITTPVFVLNAAYDSWQIQHVLASNSSDPRQYWLSCKLNIHNCDASQIKFLEGFRRSMLNGLKKIRNSKQRGMFINSCFVHCQTHSTITWHSPKSPRINNKTIAEAVGDWFFDRGEAKEVDCPYPCNPTCYNMIGPI